MDIWYLKCLQYYYVITRLTINMTRTTTISMSLKFYRFCKPLKVVCKTVFDKFDKISYRKEICVKLKTESKHQNPFNSNDSRSTQHAAKRLWGLHVHIPTVRFQKFRASAGGLRQSQTCPLCFAKNFFVFEMNSKLNSRACALCSTANKRLANWK